MILLHAQTQAAVGSAIAGQAHAVLLSGSQGSGKAHVARFFASQKLGLQDLSALDKHPYFRIITPEDNSISIEKIRAVQKFLQLKTPGGAPVRRAVLVEDAHTMTNEAQNAILKTLEEPPADTIMILTAPRTFQLRETIYSRVQQIPILPLGEDQATDYFKGQFDTQQIKKAHAMSSGLAGLMHSLLHSQDHPLIEQIQSAKSILAAPTYERLLQVDQMSKQKDRLPEFLQACKLICGTAMHQAQAQNNRAKSAQWHKKLQLIHRAEANLVHNPNAKLLLTNLFLQM